MKRRLVFTGYPCPRKPWEDLLPHDCDQKIVLFSEILRSVGKPSFYSLAAEARKHIEDFKPTSIVCHDYAVTYTLLALIKLSRLNQSPQAVLTIFNGAFRGFDIFRAPHPFRSQWIGWNRFNETVNRNGGEVDPIFEQLNPLIAALYRRVILFNFREKLVALFKARKPLNINLGVPAQIIASSDDYYIPFDCVELIRDDFGIENFYEVPYGHFPYSKNQDRIRNQLMKFESMSPYGGALKHTKDKREKLEFQK